MDTSKDKIPKHEKQRPTNWIRQVEIEEEEEEQTSSVIYFVGGAISADSPWIDSPKEDSAGERDRRVGGD